MLRIECRQMLDEVRWMRKVRELREVDGAVHGVRCGSEAGRRALYLPEMRGKDQVPMRYGALRMREGDTLLRGDGGRGRCDEVSRLQKRCEDGGRKLPMPEMRCADSMPADDEMCEVREGNGHDRGVQEVL